MRWSTLILMSCGAVVAVPDAGSPDAGGGFVDAGPPTRIDFSWVYDDGQHACWESTGICRESRTFDAGFVVKQQNVYADAGCSISGDGGTVVIDCTALCPDAGERMRAVTGCCPARAIWADPVGCSSWTPM